MKVMSSHLDEHEMDIMAQRTGHQLLSAGMQSLQAGFEQNRSDTASQLEALQRQHEMILSRQETTDKTLETVLQRLDRFEDMLMSLNEA